MTEKIEVKTTKPRGPRRSSAEIAADYKERAEKAERKARMESTPGLKSMKAALSELDQACKDAKGSDHEDKVSACYGRLNDLVASLEK